MDRKGWITTLQWTTDVGELAISQGVRPKIIKLSLKTLDQGKIIREINSLIDVVNAWRLRYEEVRRKITAHKFYFVLTGKQPRFPMFPATTHFRSHCQSLAL